MSKTTYFWCVVCGNAQGQTGECGQCGKNHFAERQTTDYEVHLYDKAPPADPLPNAPSSLPPANEDLMPKSDLQIVDQERETWTKTGDPKTTRLTLWDKQVLNNDVNPNNYSTNN